MGGEVCGREGVGVGVYILYTSCMHASHFYSHKKEYTHMSLSRTNVFVFVTITLRGPSHTHMRTRTHLHTHALTHSLTHTSSTATSYDLLKVVSANPVYRVGGFKTGGALLTYQNAAFCG